MRGVWEIVSVGVDRLLGHPGCVNRMGRRAFGKLKGHIGRTGFYEPVVVRVHPEREGYYEIINGRARVAVLQELGYEAVACVVWEVGDDEVLLLLGTLNRLRGRDDVHRKGELVRRLCERYGVDEVVKMLGEGRRSIERLRGLEEKEVKAKEESRAFLNPVVFFVDDGEKRLLDEAMSEVAEKDWTGTSAEKRRRAIVRICRESCRIKREGTK